MPSAAHLFKDPDGKGQVLSLSVDPPAYYAAADAGTLDTFRAEASSAALRANPNGTTRLYLFERTDFVGPFLRLSGGDEIVQANLATYGWDDRAQSVVCVATTQGRRIEQARSFRGLFLDRWRRTITSRIDEELARRTIIGPTTLDPDTSMTWDLAVNSRPDPREAYVRIRQGLTIQTGAGDHHATVDYLIRINVPPSGGTPAGSPVLPWSAVVDSGPESDAIKSLLEAAEPSVADAVREQLDVSFRAIFGSHRDSTMQFRAFGVYVLPDAPAVDEGPVAQGDSTGDATIVLALQPLPLPRNPLAPGPEEPQPIDFDSVDDATDLTMSPWPSTGPRQDLRK